MKRRLLSLFMAFVMLLGMLPTSVFAASDTDTPFIDIVTDSGEAVTWEFVGMIPAASAYASYEDGPMYVVTVPDGTESILVTYPGDTEIQGSGGQAWSYTLSVPGYELGYGSETFAYETNDDGDIVVTIPVENYLLEDGEGSAMSLEYGTSFDPLTFFAFEYGEAEAPHEHSYDEQITKAATCGEAGVKTFTCECGDSYTEEIPATGEHAYEDGTCTGCGKTAYVDPKVYIRLGDEGNYTYTPVEAVVTDEGLVLGISGNNWAYRTFLIVKDSNGETVEAEWALDNTNAAKLEDCSNYSNFEPGLTQVNAWGKNYNETANVTATLPDGKVLTVKIVTTRFPDFLSYSGLETADDCHYQGGEMNVGGSVGDEFAPQLIIKASQSLLTEAEQDRFDVVLRSADESVVKVDGDKFVMVGEGSTTVWAAVVANTLGNEKEVGNQAVNGTWYALNVYVGTNVLKSITFADAAGNQVTETSVSVGNTNKIKLVLNPENAENYKITATSKDTSVATVKLNDDNTLDITGVNPGQVKINLTYYAGFANQKKQFGYARNLVVNVTEAKEAKIYVRFGSESDYTYTPAEELVTDEGLVLGTYGYNWATNAYLIVKDSDGQSIEAEWALDNTNAAVLQDMSKYTNYEPGVIQVNAQGKTHNETATVTATLPDGTVLSVDVTATRFPGYVTYDGIISEDACMFQPGDLRVAGNVGDSFEAELRIRGEGYNDELTAAEQARYKVVLRTEDESVVKIEDGKFVMVGEGKTKVWAAVVATTLGNEKEMGNKAYNGTWKTLEVIVGSDILKSISFADEKGDAVTQISVPVSRTNKTAVVLNPENAANYSIEPSSENTAVATVKKGSNNTLEITGVAVGETRIKVLYYISLPGITTRFGFNKYLDVAVTEAVDTIYNVTLPQGDGYTVTGAATVKEGEDYSFTVEVAEGYDATNMVVKVNNETVTAVDGVYTVKAVSADLTVTVEGVVKKSTEADTPFISIVTDSGEEVTWSFEGMIPSSYSDGPLYIVTVPEGTESVLVTYPAGTEIQGSGGQAWSYTLSVPGYELGYGMDTFAYETNDDGDIVVTIPVESYLLSDGQGTAMSLEVGAGWDPLTFFAFVYGEAGGNGDDEVPSVTAYFSLSHDDKFMEGAETGEVMVLKKITVPYFDLANYGLEQYYFSSETYGDDGDGLPGSNLDPGTAEFAYGKVTMLHLFIYATEVYYCGIEPEEAGQGYLYDEGILGSEVFYITGSQGSSFLNYFWNYDLNLNYYHNYKYPLASEGWGSTSDQILLHDGDVVTFGHFTDWGFFNDSTSIFNYIADGDYTVTTTANRGDQLTLTVYRAGSGIGNDYNTAHDPVTYGPSIYYTSLEELSSGNVASWNYLAQADENGEFVVDTAYMEPGEYIIALAGQYGQENKNVICSTPGGILLTVEEGEHIHNHEKIVMPPTCTEDGYTIYLCECGDTYVADETDPLGHDFEDGKCKVCEELDPDYVVGTAAIKAENDAVTGKPVLTWEATENAAKYDVYSRVYKTGSYEKIATVTDTRYLDGAAQSGNKYTYYVIAVSESGIQSEKSNKTSRTCDLAQPVIKDSNDAATGKPVLSWEVIDGAVKYKIYRSTSKNSACEYVTATTETTWTDADAEPGKLYYYQVKAACENEAANSVRSEVENRRCDLAQPVVTDSCDAATGKPMLSWKKIDGAKAYEIYRSAAKGGEYKCVATVQGTSWIDDAAEAGELYYYRVKAICKDESGNSVKSEIVNRRCDLPRTTVSVTLKNNGDPKLSWEKIDGAEKYVVYRAVSKNGEYTSVKTTTKTTWTDSTVEAGVTYYYKVKAIHAISSANSAYSPVVSVKAK